MPPFLLLTGLNIHAYTHVETRSILRREDAPLCVHQVRWHRRRVILGQQWPLREPPSQQKRRRRESHRCIYRKTRPHNTRFGERIIKEPRCAGARVPVFWLTLCKQAGPRMNQRWDAGPTPWHARTESAPAAFLCTLTFLPKRTELELGGYKDGAKVLTPSFPHFDPVSVGLSEETLADIFWEHTLDFRVQAACSLCKTQDEEVFAKQKRPVLLSAEQMGLEVSG